MTQRNDGVDLEYLSDTQVAATPVRSGAIVSEGTVAKDYFDAPHSGGGKSCQAVMSSMSHLALQQPSTPQELETMTVDIKCNYARDRVEVLCGGKLILKFDHNGVCKMPVHQMELLRQVQRARPGRFVVVENTPVSAPKEPVPELPPVVENDPLEFDVLFSDDLTESALSDDQPAKAKVSKSAKKKGAVVKTAD